MNNTLRKQTIKQMFLNLIAFGIIFALFAMLIYLQISSSLFNPVRADILKAKAETELNENYIDWQINFSAMSQMPKPADKQGKLLDHGKDGPKDGNIPFRVQTVVRDSEGTVINAEALGRFAWDEALSEILFMVEDLGEFRTITASGGGVYESYAYQTEYEGQEYYVQFLANVDGEQSVVDNIVKYLVYGSVAGVIMAFVASYLLSWYSMRPIMQSWKRQTEFVENASHELRTPLTIIQNKLENLLTTPHATVLAKSQSVGVMLMETKRLTKLTSDLMTLARADSGETLLERTSFSVDELIESITEPYGEMAEMEGKTLQLNLNYGGFVTADKGRIHELLVILLDNALKYTRKGNAITVETKKDDNNLVLKVIDNGIGLSEESYEKVFNRFYREEKARSREGGGSGLGLSIARWIVKAHSGTIKIFSTDGHTVVEVKI